MTLSIEYRLPSADAFLKLRSTVSWGAITGQQAETALAGSRGGVIALLEGETIGMARFIGDGILNLYIQDVIISEKYRGKGVGRILFAALITHLQKSFPKDCFIGLFSADGQEDFYKQFGFKARPAIGFGPGMHATLSELAKSSLST